ncbi:MAG: hypothetical protein V1822_02880 [Candidatus Micrarchaeota archaeon]
MGSEEYMSRTFLGGIAKKGAKKRVGPIVPVRKGAFKHGKKVVYVTPHRNAAKEEEEKCRKKGFKTEIKKEPDDTGSMVFVVYIFE